MKWPTQRLVLGAVVVALVVLPLLMWRSIGVGLLGMAGARMFRENYDGTREVHIARHPDDWAYLFGGMAGLERLEDLAEDRSLMPKGREMAKTVHARIASGEHLPVFKFAIEEDVLPEWPGSVLWKYIYEHDSRVLKKQGVVP